MRCPAFCLESGCDDTIFCLEGGCVSASSRVNRVARIGAWYTQLPLIGLRRMLSLLSFHMLYLHAVGYF